MQSRRMIILLDAETDLTLKDLKDKAAWQSILDAASKQGELKIVRISAEPVKVSNATDSIDAAYEEGGNPLNDIGRAEFRRGVTWAMGRAMSLVENYRADPKNFRPGNESFDFGVRVACSGILRDLSE